MPERARGADHRGGLDGALFRPVKDTVKVLSDAGIRVSLFIDADVQQIDAAVEAGRR